MKMRRTAAEAATARAIGSFATSEQMRPNVCAEKPNRFPSSSSVAWIAMSGPGRELMSAKVAPRKRKSSYTSAARSLRSKLPEASRIQLIGERKRRNNARPTRARRKRGSKSVKIRSPSNP